MEAFLKSTDVINWRHPAVLAKAQELTGARADPLEIARRCFTWVRDSIQHTRDFRRDVTTCTASEVLTEGTGWCYANSHLLGALMRANGIPTGFCYQRLSKGDGTGPPFTLHGLNAVHLPRFGWYRVDSRGNKPGVDAQFSPPVEQLAFRPTSPGERDFSEILAEPLPLIVEALRTHSTCDAMYEHLPDWEFPSLEELTPGTVVEASATESRRSWLPELQTQIVSKAKSSEVSFSRPIGPDKSSRQPSWKPEKPQAFARRSCFGPLWRESIVA